MSLVELALVSLCANMTCPGTPGYIPPALNYSNFDVENYTSADNGAPTASLSFEFESGTKQRILNELGDELNGTHLRVVTAQNSPMSWVEIENNKTVGKGVAFEFMDIIAEKYNFTYDVILPQEDDLSVNSSGIFGLLNSNRADIAAAFLPVIPGLWSHIRYSRAIDRGEWVVLMNRPQESATGSGLWAPFTLRVWFLILAALLSTGPVIYGLIRLHNRLCNDDEVHVYPLQACVWFVYGALLKQGSTLSPSTDSSRLLFSTWWIFITILTAFYTANLTAFLTLSRFTLPIKDVGDIGQKKYPWVTHKGSTIEETIRDDTNSLTQSLAGSQREFTSDNGTTILSEWVRRRNFMYLGEKPIVEYLMYRDYMSRSSNTTNNSNANNLEADRCVFVITKWSVVSVDRAFAYAKGFKFHQLFDALIGSLVESGIVKFKLRERLPDTEICPLDLKSSERQLRNADLFMTYVIVGAGFIVAAVCFAVEMGMHYLGGKDITAEHQHKELVKPPGLRSSKHIKEKQLFVVRQKKFVDDDMLGDGKKTRVKFLKDMEDMFPPPPPYHALFNPPFAHSPNGRKMQINGREYWVVSSVYGDTRYIPVRTPSALLFQYTD